MKKTAEPILTVVLYVLYNVYSGSEGGFRKSQKIMSSGLFGVKVVILYHVLQNLGGRGLKGVSREGPIIRRCWIALWESQDPVILELIPY